MVDTLNKVAAGGTGITVLSAVDMVHLPGGGAATSVIGLVTIVLQFALFLLQKKKKDGKK